MKNYSESFLFVYRHDDNNNNKYENIYISLRSQNARVIIYALATMV